MNSGISCLAVALLGAAHASCIAPGQNNDDSIDSATDSVSGSDSQAVIGKTGIAWVTIVGDSFAMGSKPDVGWDNEHPRHAVAVPTFEILRTEVTVAQYKACEDDGACTPVSDSPFCLDFRPILSTQPVVCMDWNQANAFCTWAGGRLLTEAEWEFAARSRGKDITYSWGNEKPTIVLAVFNTATSSEVCSVEAGHTEQDLCDMAGNVSEWVADCQHESYDDAPADGSAWVDSCVERRMVRGGGFTSGLDNIRAAYRVRRDSNISDISIGVRCAR